LSEEETTATIGVDFKVKSIELDGERYKLSIWVRFCFCKHYAELMSRIQLVKRGSER